MCRDIVDSLLAVSRSFCVWVCHVIVDRCGGAGVFFGLVVVCGVDGVFGDDFSGGAVDGHGVIACYEDEDWVVRVGSADTEAEKFS